MYELDTPEAAVAASAMGIGLAAIGLDDILIVIVVASLLAMVAIRLLRQRRDASD
jgi:hypothetical protein